MSFYLRTHTFPFPAYPQRRHWNPPGLSSESHHTVNKNILVTLLKFLQNDTKIFLETFMYTVVRQHNQCKGKCMCVYRLYSRFLTREKKKGLIEHLM